MTMEFRFHSVQKLFETHGNYFFNAPPSTEKLANEEKLFNRRNCLDYKDLKI